MNRPNIVLIVADQFRGDTMGIAGHPDVKTPYLDTLAARGAYFPNMYSACPTCIPARAALLTGLSQDKNGRVGYQDGVDWNYEHTLAGELAALGYYTKCVGKMHVHPLRSLMGFHHIELHDGYLHYYRNEEIAAYEYQPFADDYINWLKDNLGVIRDIDDSGVQCNSFLARPWPHEEKYHPTNWATDRAIDFLRTRDRRMPFFLNVSYVRPHPPFDAPACYFDMYRDMELHPPLSGDWDDLEAVKNGGREMDSPTGTLDPELTRQAQIGYYACITHLDHQIGRLLEALPKDTVVIFTGDHGEMLMDHGMFRKSLPYRGSALVPLIIKGTQLRGRYERVGELRDILPTLVSIAGGEKPGFSDGEDLTSGEAGREYLHGEHINGHLSNHYIVTQTDKYIWFSQTGREQYFNLAKDPEEFHNAANDPEYAERIAYLREKLVKELSWRPEGFVEDGKLITGAALKAVLDFTKE
ncbi:MAG: arylsulfatase [Clostridia bacterium]|nr:arylsulfatase [Clostridia bacterium]